MVETNYKHRFAEEPEETVATHPKMFKRRAALGRGEATSRGLSRAKAQTETLASIAMVDQIEACAFLGLSGPNALANLGRLESEDKVLRFDWNGEAAYPLFQFDVSEHCIHPTLLKLIEMRTDEWGGNLAFLHWLTRPNRSLGGAKPSDRLGDEQDVILLSFGAEISAPLAG